MDTPKEELLVNDILGALEFMRQTNVERGWSHLNPVTSVDDWDDNNYYGSSTRFDYTVNKRSGEVTMRPKVRLSTERRTFLP